MPEPIDALFSTPEMVAAFSSTAHVQGMLAFEAALARSEARAGIIPAEAAVIIASHCQVEAFDIETLYREAATAGTPAIPLVRMLTAHVAGEAQKYAHWGATSQDAIDTAMMLQMRQGLYLLERALLDICAACAQLAERHRHTVMVGRTLLQAALPVTFGLKAARWLDAVQRQLRSLRALRVEALAVQLGGAAGTLAALGEQGLQVVAFLAEELELPAPDLPWHTERDRVARIATTLGIIAGTMAKIAQDLVLLSQGEVGEVSEGRTAGKGGSSAMPQKHNSVDSIAALASARRALSEVPALLAAMSQEHERAAGGWQTEWSALPALFRYTAGAVAHVGAALNGLQVDATRMKENVASTGGLIMAESLTMALAPHVGRPEAQRIVNTTCERAVSSGISLRQAALAELQIHTVLSADAIEHALDPSAYLGSTEALIDRSLNAYQEELQGSQ
ncbi:3-carboxy-cis,cis-muconate cycloisomerase [Dictyobacter aurantiacus]|uniref:3-carboxy-cis,cis-muconate cycloisomerase n=1 Tax=Dictyobacter aurantiacus TaxID=1936993 RepID=A0A401Z8G5_9CHLR|nr:3-carboxy-cis,cis-muconate cycloisomerase [Dictyobacter aurantiacus]GCE03108.1 3-carboxy-cis,cis-muconate cycloisomerase [Dictyobacter aurantiacus]